MSYFEWHKINEYAIPTVKFKPRDGSFITMDYRSVCTDSPLFDLDDSGFNFTNAHLTPDMPAFGISHWTCGKSKTNCSSLLIKLVGSIYVEDWDNPVFDEFLIYKGIGANAISDYYPIFYWRDRYWAMCQAITPYNYHSSALTDTHIWLAQTKVLHTNMG
jgi:hypothetical protein